MPANDTKTFLAPRFWTNAIQTKITELGISPDVQVAHLSRSGQMGTGVHFTKLDGATPAVFNPVVGVVLQVPRMWDRWPRLQEMLRSVVETHAKSISDIDVTYELQTAETPVGHDGQTMKVPTRSTRSAVNPSMTFIEYTGMPIINLFRTWIFDIQHPDTNMSLLPAVINDHAQIPAWYMTAYSMTMLFIQYDPTGIPDRIYDAYIIANMFPTNIGSYGFERTINQTDVKERTVQFTGLLQHNEATRELGYKVATMLQLHKVNYNYALPGVAGTNDVKKAIDTSIRSMGGLEHELLNQTGGNTTPQTGGAIADYAPDNSTAYSDVANWTSEWESVYDDVATDSSRANPASFTNTSSINNDSSNESGNTSST